LFIISKSDFIEKINEKNICLAGKKDVIFAPRKTKSSLKILEGKNDKFQQFVTF